MTKPTAQPPIHIEHGEGTFLARSELPFARDRVWDWHTRDGALERLTPPWEAFSLRHKQGGIENGARVEADVGRGPLKARWVSVHEDYTPPERFVDRMESGPFKAFRHVHGMLPLEAAPGGGGSADEPTAVGCRYEDRITYALPGGALGSMLGGGAVRDRLERMFRYRHATLFGDLNRDYPPLTILVSGASGLVGAQLCGMLACGGMRVRRLVRRDARGPDESTWYPNRGELDPSALDGVDAVVHLSGASIVDGRWTEKRKRVLWESRTKSTSLLAEAMVTHGGPKTLVTASGIGIYGDGGDTEITEVSPVGGAQSEGGAGFLAELAKAWEQAADPARAAGVRVAHVRLGAVMTPAGGALAKLLPVMQAGIGGPIGNGEQWLAWLTIDDAVDIFHRALIDPQLSGPINAVHPDRVRQKDFMARLGKILHRPAVMPTPKWALRAAFGEMADATLIGGQNALPARLTSLGFSYRQPTLEEALGHVLGRTPSNA